MAARSTDEKWQPEEMAVRAAHGDTSAFEALYEHYNDYVKETARRVVPGQRDVEDIAQSVWCKLLVKLKKFIPGAKFTTWLYIVVQHAAIDHVRQSHRRQEVSLEAMIEGGVHEQQVHSHALVDNYLQDPEIDFLLKYIEEELNNILEDLHNKNKIRGLCFRLYYIDGMSVKEIAGETHISEGTVKSHLFLARQYAEEKYPVLSDLYFALLEKLGRSF